MRMRFIPPILVLLALSPHPVIAEDVIAYGDLEPILNVCPLVGTRPAERRLQQLMFNGLMQIRRVRVGDRINLQYVPVLAEDFEYDEYSNEYVFTLRRRVEFHQGGYLSSRDIESTVRLLTDPATRGADPFFRKYIESCRTQGREVRIRLKREPFDVMRLFTFPIVSDDQVEDLGYGALSPDSLGDRWWRTDLVSEPVGTGPYRLNGELTPAGLEIIELERFDDYFDLPRANTSRSGHIDEIAYKSYAYSDIETMMRHLEDGRVIRFAAQSAGLDLDVYHTIEYGNDSVYYIGFNYRPDRAITVCQPGAGRSRGRTFVELDDLSWSDILLSEDNIRGQKVGRLFREYLWSGFDRAGFLSVVDRNATAEERERRLQSSIFPAGSPPDADPEIRNTGERFIPPYDRNAGRVVGFLLSILDEYLDREGLRHFVFSEKRSLETFEEETGIQVQSGLFTLYPNNTRALSMKLIYSLGDKIVFDIQKFKAFLTNAFLQMGIVLQLEGIDKYNFPAAVREGDWDLVLTSYDVPGDYNAGPVFSSESIGEQNIMGYRNPEIDEVLTRLDQSTIAVQYAQNLRELNSRIMMDLPAVLLFSVPNTAAYPKGLFDTDHSMIQFLCSYDYLFDQVEKWEMN